MTSYDRKTGSRVVHQVDQKELQPHLEAEQLHFRQIEERRQFQIPNQFQRLQ